MKTPPFRFVTASLSLLVIGVQGATLYVDLNSPNPTPPYSDWSTAATNIQVAIEAANPGDTVLVTNGVYNTGGQAMAGTLTNRVALDRAVMVQSVNGPFVTVIQGAGATNGFNAIRCAWLTNNATLIGFTLTQGATQPGQSGGGVWCASSNSIVMDCVIASNAASFEGSGAFQGTLNNCLVRSNGLSSGVVYSATVNNCTVVSNGAPGVVSCQVTNSIVYYNGAPGAGNYSGATLSYCCATPLPTGPGNFTNAPQLLPDGVHLSTNSPCVGAGTTPATGADLFGSPWANPPSVGCAEVPNIPVIMPPTVQLTGVPVGFTITNNGISAVGPLTFSWLKDGVLVQDNGNFGASRTANLVVSNVNLGDAGAYQLIVSSAFGVVTSAVAQVVVHCVAAGGGNPVAPYTNWMTAATNIQDAVTVAGVQDIILVTNGVYTNGGISMDGIITNRVSLNKVLLVQSMNGPSATVIQGAWDPVSTNGPAAVRCVWMTNNSILSGFTVYGGATRSISNPPSATTMAGGGVWASSKSAIVWNCVIATNYASNIGGGANAATLIDCELLANQAVGSGTAGAGIANAGSGGGAVNCNLQNCLVIGNSAIQSNGGGAQNCNATNSAFVNNHAPLFGSGIYEGNVVNCTLVNNNSTGYSGSGGGVASAMLTNCIVYGTIGSANYVSCIFGYSDTDPLPPGAGNIDVNPQLLADNIHLASTSPCIGAGLSSSASGSDIDGETWNNPPSVGCDEWYPEPVIAIQPGFQAGLPSRRSLSFSVLTAGQAPFNYYWYYNGTLIQDTAHYSNSGTSNLIVSGFEPNDAGAYQVVVSNSFGVVTSQVAQVVIHTVDANGGDPVAPYSTWSTAATRIQDAIDAANNGDVVLVTNGIYAAGGKVVAAAGDITNRVAIDKALTVISVNGYAATLIQGQPDPFSINGPGAVRCAWLNSGATLYGFTLANGATCANEVFSATMRCGGGALLSTNALVSNCVLTNNNAEVGGGGAAFGTVNNSFIVANTVSVGGIGGGGVYSAILNDCTVLANTSLASSSSSVGGILFSTPQNCIVLGNFGSPFGNCEPYQICFYTCSDPLPLGTGNIDTNLVFLDSTFHLPAVSPIRGAGSSLYATGTDLDDQPWANPPSMGCSELVLSNLVGPLAVAIRPPRADLLVNDLYGVAGTVTGRAESLSWSLGDGTIVTNGGYFINHVWTNAGQYTVTLTAYNLDNPSGVSTNVTVVVDPVMSPMLGSAQLNTNSSFQFSFLGQTNATYTVQYATNLIVPVTWQNLQTLFSTGEVMMITDPLGTNALRFYRVQAR